MAICKQYAKYVICAYSCLHVPRTSRLELAWKISKMSLQNILNLAGASFLSLFFSRVAGCRPAVLLKWNSCTCAFLWILRNLLDQLFSTFVNGCFSKTTWIKLDFAMFSSQPANVKDIKSWYERFLIY